MGFVDNYSSGGAATSGGEEVLALAPSEFFDPRVLFRSSATQWRKQDWDSGHVYTASTAIFTADQFVYMLSHDLSELWALVGSVTALQRINKITIATNVLAQNTVISGQNLGDIISVACRDPRTGTVFCGARDAIAADGLMNFYTLNMTTGVLTFVAKSDVFLSTANQGMGIDPSDGQIYLCTEPSGVPSFYKIDKDTAQGALVYTCAANTPWRCDNFNITPRGTFFGQANALCSEGSLPNFGFLRGKTQAGVTPAVNVMVPPINSKMYLGCPIYKVGTSYYLADGEDITALITSATVLWPLEHLQATLTRALQMNGISTIIAFGGVTTAYAVAITAVSSYQSIKFLDVSNGTDKDVYLSVNSTQDQLVVPAGKDKQFDLGALGFRTVTNVWQRSTANATSGNLSISAIY